MLMIPAPSANVVVPSGTRMNFFSVFVTLGVTAVGGLGLLLAGSVAAVVVAGVIGLLLGMAPQVAKQWERAVVLRLGRFDGLRGAAAEVILHSPSHDAPRCQQRYGSREANSFAIRLTRERRAAPDAATPWPTATRA